LPTSTVTLSGSGTDADGTIASYAWTRTYGPTATITSASSASTTITGITQTGIYGFRLTVTDNLGATAYDDIDVYVDPAANVLPVANAGTDKSITLPTSTVSLTGSGTDADGSITAYNWAKVSGPAGQTISTPNSATTNITGLVQGTYVFRLRVTDNDGGQHTDNVTVTVNPAVVVPNTGNWIFTGTPTIELGNDLAPITLGTKFRASQAGAITRIRFFKSYTNTGTHVGGIYSAGGTLLQSGTFTGETSEGWQYLTLPDTVFIAANTTYIVALYCPSGEYGYTEGYFLNSTTNNYMTAPASNSVGGNGVYAMGGSLTFPTSTFNQTNYWIDAEWLDVTQTVPVNTLPIAGAGLDQAITLPTSSVTLTGSGTDADGTISAYLWTKVSGTGGIITSSTSSSTTVTGLSAGTYVFRLRVTDNSGGQATDDVQIIVNASPPANILPIANAGANQSITLPTSSVSLTGSGTDADGTIASYAWTKVSGTGGTITSPSNASTTITGLAEGTYVYRLTVTDNLGATATDDIQIIVNFVPTNVGPSVSAGLDIVIKLPISSHQVTATAADTDGTISTYDWSQIGGPVTAVISDTAISNPTISGMTTGGVYTFLITVTDDDGATASDLITIAVNSADTQWEKARTFIFNGRRIYFRR
jgi:hypothetical protein